ncbi:hypothetical protein [Holdemania massiliensis]|uniref:hypothetical protein n=1 Tax=Holdemania massiliensis TaxID=1468449 RepID=UPI001F050DE0|nr:hypothetical protein [Holdemania massiliensis]MCH1942368.1 hypothetical protein [Holdemania massiliensis]
MKKFLFSFLVLALLAGCAKPVVDSENETELNPEEIIAGDFSSIAGEYINSEGKITILDKEDIKRKLLDVIHADNEHCYLNVRTDDGFGVGLFIYNVGVEIPNLEGLTDTTKIRIYYGQDAPRYIEEIFNRK